MKKNFIIAVILISTSGFSQNTFPKKNSVGFECLGNAGLYSVVYNRTFFTTDKFNFQIRPQLSVIPGETESEIPRNLVTILGVNSQLTFNNWLLNLNLSTGLDINWGAGNYGTRMISAVSFGPKLRTDFAIWGLSYGYFLQEPEFFYFDTYPHFLGLSIEVEL